MNDREMADTRKAMGGWPGTREGLLDAIATAQALSWSSTTTAEYLHWLKRQIELEKIAGELTAAESVRVWRTAAAKSYVYDSEREA
jgi:hypothetical protein